MRLDSTNNNVMLIYLVILIFYFLLDNLRYDKYDITHFTGLLTIYRNKLLLIYKLFSNYQIKRYRGMQALYARTCKRTHTCT